jgi:hypothetical protein
VYLGRPGIRSVRDRRNAAFHSLASCGVRRSGSFGSRIGIGRGSEAVRIPWGFAYIGCIRIENAGGFAFSGKCDRLESRK